MILVVVACIVAAAILVRLSVPLVRRQRLAATLRGDWWSRFEREFRAYASNRAASARDAEQRS